MPTDEWRLLPLPDSDVLGAGLLAAVRSARETGLLRVRSELSEAGFEEELRRVLSACSDSEPILTALSRVSQIGLLEIRLGALQNIAHELIEFDRDSMISVGKDMSLGTIVQLFEHAQKVTYELETWGFDLSST